MKLGKKWALLKCSLLMLGCHLSSVIIAGICMFVGVGIGIQLLGKIIREDDAIIIGLLLGAGIGVILGGMMWVKLVKKVRRIAKENEF